MMRILYCILAACLVTSMPCVARADEASANALVARIEAADQTTLAPEIKAAYEELKSQINEIQEIDNKYKSELEDNAKDMRDKEQSTANKLIGAAGIGLTGAGLRNTMEGMAEMQLDENTTQSMKAYLQTFRCNYGGGSSYKGGEENIELPGAGALMPLVTEYKTLASELKEMKLALDMKPGIESQEILDSATMGLHDDVRHGIESGAFTSVSRALLNENGEDAAAWAKQGTDAKHKRNTGAGMAAVGAVGSAVASAIANKDAPKERSEEIKRDYEKKKAEAESQLAAAETQLNDAINQNRQRVQEYNNLLKQHQDFIAGATDKDCLPAGYVDAINALKPATEFQDTSGLVIEYDLDKIKQEYQSCVDAKLQQAPDNPIATNPDGTPAVNPQMTIIPATPPLITIPAPDMNICNQIGGFTWTDNQCVLDNPADTTTNPPTIIAAPNQSTCEQIPGYVWTDGQCILTEMPDTPTDDGVISASAAASYGGGTGGNSDITDQNQTSPEIIECNNTPNHIWDPINQECQENPPLDSPKCPRWNPEFPDIGSIHKVGGTCSGLFIAVGNIVKIKQGKHAGTCTCEATQCYKIGDDVNLSGGRTVKHIERKQVEENGMKINACVQNIVQYADGQCAPFYDYVMPYYDTEEQREAGAWNVCARKCAQAIKKQNCTNKDPKIGLAFRGPSTIHKNTSTYRCTCATSDEEYQKMLNERRIDEAERRFGQLEADQSYRHTCATVGGTADNKTSFCDENTFKDTQVTQLQALGLVRMYIKKKYMDNKKSDQFNKDLIFCKSDAVIHNNDDYLQCYDAKNVINYEFRFDDVTESIDSTIQDSVKRAICHNLFGFKYYKNSYDETVCNVSSASECALLGKNFYESLGIDTAWANSNRQCVVSSRYKRRNDLKTYGGINNEEFCGVFDMQGSSTVQQYVETYIRNFLTNKGMPPTRVRCNDNVSRIYPYCGGGTTDDVLTCYADGHQIDFVFDDLSEAFNYNTEGGLQAMACKSALGTFTGKTCNGVGKEQCEQLRKQNTADCPKCGSIKWNEEQQVCELPDAAYATNMNTAQQVAVIAGTTIVAAVVTVASGGTATPAVVLVAIETVGAGVEIGATVAIQNAIDDFFNEANRCNNATCAQSLITKYMKRMNDFKGDATAAQVQAIDDIMAKLLELVPEESPLWDNVITKMYEEGGVFSDWQPEHFVRALGVAMQFASVFTSIFKSSVKSFTKFPAVMQKRLTAVEKNLNRATNRLAKMKKGSKAYKAQEARIAELRKQEDLVARARRGEPISEAELAGQPQSVRQSVRNAANDANPHTAQQIADDGAKLKRYDQLLEKERAGKLTQTEQQELNQIRNRWGHPSDDVIEQARVITQQKANAAELKKAEDDLRKWEEWAKKNPGLVKSMSKERKAQVAALRKKVSDLGGNPDAISPLSRQFDDAARLDDAEVAETVDDVDDVIELEADIAEDAALRDMRSRTGLDDLFESAASTNSAHVKQFRKYVATETEADEIVARLQAQGIYAGKLKTGDGKIMVSVVENAEDYEKLRPYVQKPVKAQTGAHAASSTHVDDDVQVAEAMDDVDDVIELEVDNVVDAATQAKDIGRIINESVRPTNYNGINAFVTENLADKSAANAMISQLRNSGYYATRIGVHGSSYGEQYVVIAMSRAEAASKGLTESGGSLLRTLNNANLNSLQSKIGRSLGTVNGKNVYIESFDDFGVHASRPILMVKVGERKIPFYVSTGTAGKTDVPTGKWEFFGGISPDSGWFNKGTLEMIQNHYGSPELKQIANLLDTHIGDVRDMEYVLESIGRQSRGGQGIVAGLQNANPISPNYINRHLNYAPAASGREQLKKNLNDIKEYLSSKKHWWSI